MSAFLILLGTLFTWIALYQGILAYAIGPPPDRELVTVSGIVVDVDTLWTRNRFVPATQVKIEVAPVRYVTVPVRQVTRDAAALKSLLGKQVTATFAGLRPRNRWVYALSSEGAMLADLTTERERDHAAHARSIRLMLLNGLIAAGLMIAAWQFKKRRNARAQSIGTTS